MTHKHASLTSTDQAEEIGHMTYKINGTPQRKYILWLDEDLAEALESRELDAKISRREIIHSALRHYLKRSKGL